MRPHKQLGRGATSRMGSDDGPIRARRERRLIRLSRRQLLAAAGTCCCCALVLERLTSSLCGTVPIYPPPWTEGAAVAEMEGWPELSTFLRAYVAQSRPLLMRGVARSWRATSLWSTQFFRSDISLAQTPIELVGSNPEGGNAHPLAIETTLGSFADYLDALLAGNSTTQAFAHVSDPGWPAAIGERLLYSSLADDLLWYEPEEEDSLSPVPGTRATAGVAYRASAAGGDHGHRGGRGNGRHRSATRDTRSRLWDDVDGLGPLLRSAIGRGGDATLGVWIGSPGSTTGLHYDSEPLSILHQVAGTKQVTLYHPSQAPFLYPGGRFYPYTENSRVDLRRSAATIAARWPLFAHARPVRVTLRPGDALYIPINWWHSATVTAGLGISVSKMVRTRCQAWALWPEELFRLLHAWGLYRRQSCICHPDPVYEHEGSAYWADDGVEDDPDDSGESR